MPRYEYRCTECDYIEEHPMKMCESHIDIECFNCGAKSVRIPSCGSFELKGGGWYASGYSKGD